MFICAITALNNVCFRNGKQIIINELGEDYG